MLYTETNKILQVNYTLIKINQLYLTLKLSAKMYKVRQSYTTKHQPE